MAARRCDGGDLRVGGVVSIKLKANSRERRGTMGFKIYNDNLDLGQFLQVKILEIFISCIT